MNKTKKRLILYLVLSFGLTYAWFALTNPKGKTWDDMSTEMQSFVALGMLFPTISHVLTRWITKEGFAMSGKGSMMLGISFKNRKWIYYLAAILLPCIYIGLGDLISLALCPKMYDPQYYLTIGLDKKTLLLFPLTAIISSVAASFAAFGEEGGWRGYMMPKLLELMGRKKAMVIGGIIWGLWHAPITCIGHNFGTDYPGFPYMGILYMCLFCILIGILLTYVTEKSGSVWPAAFMHAVNNAQPSILKGYINPDKVNGTWLMSPSWCGMMTGLLLTLVVVCVIWKKREKGDASSPGA